jgi:hypothetical protein
MQKIRKLRLSIKAISPIISVLLLIAIAVVASLVVYAWVMGYIGGSTTKAGYAINIQSFSSTQNGNLTIYVQNTGQGAVQLNPASAVYINSSLVQPILSPAAGANGLITIPQGQTTALIVYYPYSGPITVKIVTTSGTFMTTSGTSNGSGTTYSVSFNTSGGGGSSTTSPSGTGPYAGPITISANAGAGYSFSAWSATGSITFTDAASSSTTATVNGAGTVTATFTKTNYQVTFVTSPTGAGTTSPSTAGSYTMGQQVSISAVAGSNYKFSSWSATGVTIADASSASTTATVNGAGTVTANFIALHILTSITISPASSSIAAGGSQSYTAAGFDQNGVSMGDVTSSSTFSVNGASISGSSVTEASAGSYSVTASDGGVTSNTATLTVFGVLTSFSFGPINSPQAAGSPFTVTIAAQDAGSHTITNFAGSAALTDLSGTLSVNTGPFTNGVWTGPVTITKPLINDVITATASSVVGQSGMFNINSGAATSFAVTGFTNPVAAGTAGSVTVTAMDAYGNTATGYTGTVAITSSDIQAVLPPSATLTNGVRFFVVTLKTAGTQSIIATDTVTSTITGSQTGIIVNAGGSAASFVVSGFTNPVAAGTAGSVTVTAVDAYGNVVTGYAGTVAITSSDAKAVLPASAGLINGLGSFAVTLKTAGSQSITATDTVTNSMTGSQTGITVTAGSLASFTFGTISSPTAGTPFMITITAYDASGNVATNYAGTAMLTDVTGSLSPTSATFIAGVYSGPVTISKTMVNDAITVTDSASGVTATSTAFTVSPGPLASFTISTISNPQTAGTPGFSITITAYDSLGNVETNYVGPAGLSDLSGSLSPTSVAFTAGVYTSKVTIGTANTADVITVKDSSTSITASSNSFNVVAGTVAHFVFNTIGQQTAGTAFTVTITAKDTGGNTVLGYTGSASFTDLSGSISLKSTGVFTNGVLQASVAISKAYANDVITATDTTTGATGTSNTFTVVAAPATQLVFTAGVGQSLTASTVSLVITVQLQDSNGNPVAAGTGGVSVSLTSTDTTTGTFWSDAAGTIKITAPITILAGQSSYSFYYSDTASGSPTLTASSTGLTSATTTFTISTDKLVFVQGATQTLAPGQTSTGIVIEQETPTGSPDYIILGTTQITVTTSSPTGEFSTTPGGTLTHSITVDVTGLFAYESSTFYYVDSAAGTPELTAVAGGFTPGTTMFTIYTATLSSFKITSTSSPVAVGASFSITITALDQQAIP